MNAGSKYWSVLRPTRNGYKRFRDALKDLGYSATPEPVLNEPKWLDIARHEIGEKEIPGSKDNPRIVEYGQATSLKPTDDETPWCSDFVNWVMLKAGLPRTNSAAAISWATYGVKLDKPKYGCIAVYSRTGGNHVAFWLSEQNGQDQLLGGNQNDQVGIELHSKSSLISYRWPNA